jgi:ABC-type Fe3+/spermidine/putrescine transport system ATPase subunit
MTLHISNLSKRYGKNWVLRDVSFSVEKGRVLGVLAPLSGGKTTLLRILAGREKPTPADAGFGLAERTVTFCERETAGWRAIFGRGTTHSDSSFIDRSLEQASDILLLDDPMRLLDRELRDRYLERIRELTSEKELTVIYATSDFETAALVADQIVVLANGLVQQTGAGEELYERPSTSAVAKLTGRCNIISARRLTSTKYEVPEFQTIDGGHRLFAERADIAKLGAINRNVSLAIRPENISMSFGASFPEDNLIKAAVTGVKFLGPVTQVELDADGLSLSALVFRLVGLGIGQECLLGLPPERIKILKD